MWSVAYVGFGANLGDPEATLMVALEKIGALNGVSLRKVSSIYQTAPVGLVDGGPEFLNAAMELKTELKPLELMNDLRKIERALGKHRQHRSDRSRKIDLDLLLFGGKRFVAHGVEIPHPRMDDRAFVLVPLVEIAPDLVHPKLKLTLKQMLEKLNRQDVQDVRLLKTVDFNQEHPID
ncbi:MAG: 2-amino-4-hydroxy-6-hydroxymethyldihydropteridine diphosphokinase [Pseudomonadota bacterium]